MSNAILPSSSVARVPIGPNVTSVLDEVCRSNGMTPPTSAEAANLPPWTKEEADAFERTIIEMFEHIEESSKLL